MDAPHILRKTSLRWLLRRLPLVLLISLSPIQAAPGVTASGYTFSGNGELVWALALGDTGRDRSEGVFVDDAGNVFTTGGFEGTVDFDPGPGAFFLTSPGWSAIYVWRLDGAGNLVWARAFGGTGNGAGWSIFVDGSGAVFTTGVFSGTLDFDPGPGTFNLTSVYGADCFVSKLDSAGNFVWAKALGGLYTDYGQSIFVDEAGNVLTTGVFELEADFDPGPGTYNLTGAGCSIFSSASWMRPGISSGPRAWGTNTMMKATASSWMAMEISTPRGASKAQSISTLDQRLST